MPRRRNWDRGCLYGITMGYLASAFDEKKIYIVKYMKYGKATCPACWRLQLTAKTVDT